jgi:hypothetical protein
MMNFIFCVIMTSYRKITSNFCFGTQFSQFSKIKKLMLIRLLATTLSPLKLTFSNSKLALLAI